MSVTGAAGTGGDSQPEATPTLGVASELRLEAVPTTGAASGLGLGAASESRPEGSSAPAAEAPSRDVAPEV